MPLTCVGHQEQSELRAVWALLTQQRDTPQHLDLYGLMALLVRPSAPLHHHHAPQNTPYYTLSAALAVRLVSCLCVRLWGYCVDGPGVVAG